MIDDPVSPGREMEYELRIEKLVYGGDALARLPDGRAVFVPYALPNEYVRLRVVEQKRTYARAELIEVIEPSPDRIAARCQHFTTCGGCHYQHLTYDLQLKAKTEILIDQLERIGGLESPPVVPCAGVGPEWEYRNQIQFHVSDTGALGFQRWRSNDIIPIQECHLPCSPIQAAWRQFTIDAESAVHRLILRAGMHEDVIAILEGGDADAIALPENIPLSVVRHTSSLGHTYEDVDKLVFSIFGREFNVSADSFFQTNVVVAEAMVAHLLENLPLSDKSTLLELYSGVGMFSAFLAPRVDRLIAVESSPAACDDFVANLEEFENVELYQDKAENVLPALKFPVEILVMDPPRAGLDPRVVDAILQKIRPNSIAYISCDPATLARDSRKLTAGGYRLLQVCPFDMFPQTFHIESISYWEAV